MKLPDICCQRCGGSGVQKLPKRLKPAFDAISKLNNPTVPEIHRSINRGKSRVVTAINHQVNQLVKFGLVEALPEISPKRYRITSKSR